MRWRRLRKWAKWGCTVGAVLMILVWLASAWVRFSWVDSQLREYGISAGCFEYYWAPGTTVYVMSRRSPGWSAARPRPGRALRLWPRGWEYEWGSASEFIDSPLWPLFVLPGSAAIALWLMDGRAERRARALRCVRCGYDRGGLSAGVQCPECGTAPD
jgi:hypothetical protein